MAVDIVVIIPPADEHLGMTEWWCGECGQRNLPRRGSCSKCGDARASGTWWNDRLDKIVKNGGEAPAVDETEQTDGR